MPQRIEMWRPPRRNIKIKSVEGRPNAAARGYCSARHKAWRKAVLERDGYTCRECGRVCGSSGEAHADHVIPIAERPDLRYEVANGQCLCHPCHSRKTNADQHRFF